MRRFRRCLWCGNYSLIPCTDDFIEETKERLTKETESNPPEITVEAFASSTRLLAENKQNCSYCNEPFFGNFLEKSQYEERGYALYEEYKKFMKGVPLPDKIKIEVVKSDKFGGEVRFDKALGLFIVYFNEDTCYNPYDVKPFYYHEFDHVAQKFNPSTNSEKEDSKWRARHEYEASEIEMMARLGYKSINHKKNINLSSKVIHKNKTMTLVKYFDCIIDENLKFIKNQSKSGLNAMAQESIIRAISYNLGKINFCINQIDDELVKYIPNLNKIYDYVKTLLIDEDFVEGFNGYVDTINNNINDKFSEIDIDVFDDIIVKIWTLLSINIQNDKRAIEWYKYKEFNKITGWLKEMPLDILEKSKEDK